MSECPIRQNPGILEFLGGLGLAVHGFGGALGFGVRGFWDSRLRSFAFTVEARRLEHHYPRALKVKYRESQQESS